MSSLWQVICREQVCNAHWKSRRNTVQTVTNKYTKMTNDELIDPKEYLPYQLGDKEDTRDNMKTIQRQRASEKRTHEMAEKEIDFSKIPYFGDVMEIPLFYILHLDYAAFG